MEKLRKYKSIISLALIFCLSLFICSIPRRVYAIAPAIGLAAAAVLAVGASAGMSYQFSNAGADEVASRLQAFLDDCHPGTAIADYFSNRAAEIKDGAMYLGSALYNRIKEFFQWESTSNNVSAGQSGEVYSFGSDGFDLYDGTSIVYSVYNKSQTNPRTDRSGTYWDFPAIGSDIIIQVTSNYFFKIGVELNSSNYPVAFLSCSYDAGDVYTKSGTGPALIGDYNEKDYKFTFFLNRSNQPALGYYSPHETYGNVNSDQFGWSGLYTVSALPVASITGMTMNHRSALTLSASQSIDFPTVSEGQSVCVDVGLSSSATADQWVDVVIDSAIDGTLSSNISNETYTVDVVTTPQEIATIDQPIEQEVTPDPVTPSEQVDFDTPSHYTVRDLRSFFPFCIPFDIIAMLGLLAADPVPPHFEWRFNPEWLDVDYTVVLDFSEFNDVAALFRKLELLSFCVGLAFATRYLIKG